MSIIKRFASTKLQQFVIFMLATLLTTHIVLAHDGKHKADNIAKPERVLGHLTFATSSHSKEAQDAFEQGMLLLHLFEYPFAIAEFKKAQSIDSHFAMAYWGEAMAYNYPIWDMQFRDKAQNALNAFAPTIEQRQAKLKTKKEKDYFKSLDILYGLANSDTSKYQRDMAYKHFLSEMAQRYPGDVEVQLFYALAILGSHGGVRDIPDYMEAAAIAQKGFYANRQHPGAAHYLIHAVDDPIHAPLGLEAARALYKMAPDAGHSLHMTSHIFNALGMWDDVVMANTNAVKVANHMRAERGEPASHVGHYNFWLLYGLLQQGNFAQAKQLLETAYEEITHLAKPPKAPMILDPDSDPVGSLLQMWSRYVFETGGTDTEVLNWTFNLQDAFDPNLNLLYVKAFMAKDPERIRALKKQYKELVAKLRRTIMTLPEKEMFFLEYLKRTEVIEQQLEAFEQRAKGNLAAAIASATKASELEGAMPYEFGPPFVDYPSAQLLGELNLIQGNYADAAAAFAEALKRARNKVQAVKGLAQARDAMGQQLK
ncbi:hypothetical protein [uncultured Paraglaciecola sp.]|uniref:hypothetical protein n=1 Tax=uncultured Paraglaciecola sp. TaxID=1765024 RepID=UPI00260D7D03|nr:hypothetical protein [uncultured Paraglaciecola sp.]